MINLETLETLTQKYYSFAYVLLPEELMATQLLIDAATKLCLSESPDNSSSLSLESCYVLAIYELALSRQKHFNFKADAPFYRLPLEQRAVIFLRDKRQWSIDEIAQSLGLGWDRLYSLLNLGRSRVLDMTISSSFDGVMS